MKQQKVVVTGNVDSETLIKKLVKTGKHAELWPEKADSKEKKQSKGKNKEKQSDQEICEDGNHADEKEKETVKVEVQGQDPARNCEGGTSKNGEGGNVIRVSEAGVATVKTGGQLKEPKPDQAKQTVTILAGSQPPVAGDGENGVEKSGGGSSGGKKKKKKGQKANNNNIDEAEHSSDPLPCTGSPNHGIGHGQGSIPATANGTPPRQHAYQEYPPRQHAYQEYPPRQHVNQEYPPRQQVHHQYPQHYYPPPVYTTSYNMANPSSSYGTSYYTSPAAYSYAYVHPGTGLEAEPETDRPPYDYDSHAHQPADTFEFFSDENPNACSIM